MGVRVPAPRRVFLPWVAGQRCWSSCYCSWQPLPRRPPQRPSLPATRLVIQRAGAGTSDRERGPRGVGAGDDGSALRPPPTVTELGPAGRAKTNTELVSGRGVSPRSGGDPVSGSDTPPKACANCVLSVKTVHSLFFIWSWAALCNVLGQLNSLRTSISCKSHFSAY